MRPRRHRGEVGEIIKRDMIEYMEFGILYLKCRNCSNIHEYVFRSLQWLLMTMRKECDMMLECSLKEAQGSLQEIGQSE